jgi:hypothetical protein
MPSDKLVYALPMDIFRILAGFLCLIYFVTLGLDTKDFSASTGLINHTLSYELFSFTRLGLFHGTLPAYFFYMVYGAAGLFCMPIIVGYRPRTFAFLAFLIAVSAYRWNFLVIYVDDVVMHLLLFWLTLLPLGRTLNLFDRFVRPHKHELKTGSVLVGTFELKAFIYNICLIYWIAGFSKIASPMWQEGTALYAVLKLPISQFPEMWGLAQLTVLRWLNHLALITEIAIPFLLIQKRSLALKVLGGAIQILFHLGIIFTIGIPFANLALIGSLVLFFSQEFTERFAQTTEQTSMDSVRRARPVLRLKQIFVCLYLFGLTLTGFYEVKNLQVVAKFGYVLLWTMGLAQNYHLFNWIDSRNYTVKNEITKIDADGRSATIPGEIFLPRSVRHTLLQMNLYGFTWLPMTSHRLHELQPQLICDILWRYADRYCRTQRDSQSLAVLSRVSRLRGLSSDEFPMRNIPLCILWCDHARLTAMKSLYDPPAQTQGPFFCDLTKETRK